MLRNALPLLLCLLCLPAWGSARSAAERRAPSRRIPPREELFKDVPGLRRHFDVAYGKDDPTYQRLDAYLVAADGPSPVLMQYHAGGYIGGDKSQFIGRSADKYEAFLRAGISLVSCHYRLAPRYKFPAQLHDTARSIQFVRSKARQWRIDPNRIAAVGGSAGGHLATWVALAPDFADANSADPVARQSSRVCCFIGCGPLYMANIKPLPVQVLKVFGCTQQRWDNPDDALRKRIAYATPATHLTPDDPPGLLHYMKPPDGLERGQDFSKRPVPAFWSGPHDTWHGIKLAREMEKRSVEVVRYLGRTAGTAQQLAFLRKHLRIEARPKASPAGRKAPRKAPQVLRE